MPVSHDALLATFHAQPLCVDTLIEPDPAAAPMLAAPGDNDHVQPVGVPDFVARKFATVSAFWLCTRATSAVADEPVGLAGLPYITFGLDMYAMRVHETPTAAHALLYDITSRHRALVLT